LHNTTVKVHRPPQHENDAADDIRVLVGARTGGEKANQEQRDPDRQIKTNE
jgi:hypothetical protein